jgi:hypothetical protein
MSIERFFTNTFVVSRMEWSNESSAEVSAGTFKGHIQQAQPEASEHVGEAWGKTFVIWCDESTDVQSGDSISVASGNYAGTYSVKQIQNNATGDNKHLELTVIKDF